MEFATSWPGKDLPSKFIWIPVTPRPENRYVNYISVKFTRMFISSCGIIFSIFYLTLYLFAREGGMVGADVWCVPTLRFGAFIICFTIGGA